MTYSEIIPIALKGKTLLLPGWHGYFYWNYNTQELNFRDGEYHLDSKDLMNLNVDKRTDWYYII